MGKQVYTKQYTEEQWQKLKEYSALTSVENERAYRVFVLGETIEDVAESTGKSPSTIYQTLRVVASKLNCVAGVRVIYYVPVHLEKKFRSIADDFLSRNS